MTAFVFGLLERRTGKVLTSVCDTGKKHVLQAKIHANVEPGAALYRDALKFYDGLDSEYAHQVIDHAEAYVDGNAHTNKLENFWSLLKRTIKGTYVSVEPSICFVTSMKNRSVITSARRMTASASSKY